MHDHAHDHHAHAHDHAHDHSHDQADASGTKRAPFTAAESRQVRRLSYVLALVSTFFVVELTGALLANSTVLQADAIHLLMDVLALAMSLLAMRIAVRKPTPKFTFGLRRAEPVAAIFNAMLVMLAIVLIVHEGIEHLELNEPPKAGLMLIVSIGALVVNGLSAWLLHDTIGHAHGHGHEHHHHDHGGGGGHQLNLRGARLHILGDVLGSLAALVAAIAIRMGGPASIDPIASFVVAAILLFGALRLLRDAMLVLLEAAPPHLNIGTIRTLALGVEGVGEIHSLHVWSLGAGHDAITLHVSAASPAADLAVRVSNKLRKALNVEYVTVQIEPTEGPRPSHCE